tara:strand:- start:2225 stop:3169 length:945 start_codon:yes stop_codon:yes gene_type:complete
MGIRGLNTLIKKYSPDSITYNDVTKYKNSIVAIDASILLYKFKYASKAENSHLIGIINRIKFYLMNSILPVFIFDGVPPDEKKITLEKRQAQKEKIYIKLEELKRRIPETDEERENIENEINRINNQIINVKKHHVEECKILLEKSGIPYVIAPNDAEKYCSFIQQNGLVDYTITDDTDAITFYCKKILKTSINSITEINTDKILEDFEMNRDMFIDYCILSGCDYTDTISQIGPIKSFNLIKKHKCIEEVLKTLDKQVCNFNFLQARKIFKEFDYDVPEKFSLVYKDKDELISFLNSHDVKKNVINKFIKILK